MSDLGYRVLDFGFRHRVLVYDFEFDMQAGNKRIGGKTHLDHTSSDLVYHDGATRAGLKLHNWRGKPAA